MRLLKRLLRWAALGLLTALLVAGGYVGAVSYAYGRSLDQVYDVPLPAIERSTDPAVIARGQHLARSLGGCALADCHGADLGGGRSTDVGPIGTIVAPNITSGGRGAQYSDGETARIILHGIKRDGRTVRLMPSNETSWLPDRDVRALVSFVRSVPPVTRPSAEMHIGIMGRVLDRHGMMPIDIARRIDHASTTSAPDPAPTLAYGRYIGRMCQGCHGERLSGGPLPGAPPSMAVPLNLTRHETGLAGWTYEDFVHCIETGTRKDGRRLDAFMPIEALASMDDTERHALWAFIQSVPARPFGQR